MGSPTRLLSPEVALVVVVEVRRLTLPLAAADLTRPLHAGPVDGNLAEEQAQAFGPGLQPPGRQVEGHRHGLARQDGRQHHRLWRTKNIVIKVKVEMFWR